MTEEARDGWRDFCDRQGIDRTALAEVMGRLLATIGEDEMTPTLRQLVEEARDLRNERRRRG